MFTEELKQLKRRRESPDESIAAAFKIGREAHKLRQELDHASDLGNQEVQEVVDVLGAMLWEREGKAAEGLRDAAAWALGQSGGLMPIRALLRRGLAVLDPQQLPGVPFTADVATLIDAIDRASDWETLRKLDLQGKNHLRRLVTALSNLLDRQPDLEPDLKVAIIQALVRFALTRPDYTSPGLLGRLLRSDGADGAIAAVTVLDVLIRPPTTERRKAWLQGELATSEEIKRLESERGQAYTEDALLNLRLLLTQYWLAQNEFQTTGV